MAEDRTTPWALGSRYVVLGELLGRGTFGSVYLGEDRTTGRRVAIKVFEGWLRDNPTAVQRILSERSLLASVESDHVVRVRDLIAEGDVLALVSDFVDGVTLREFAQLRSSPGVMSEAEAANILIGVLEGLASLHAHGIVHRDLKPENILVRSVDSAVEPVLIDFGLAILASDAERQIVGSPYYMAPEAIVGKAVSAKLDVYAAGVILYELLSGRTPFEGSGTVAALLRKQLEATPPRPAGVHEELWLLLQEMLAKDPRERPEAADVCDRLRQLLPQLSRDLSREALSAVRVARRRLNSAIEPFLDLPLDAGSSTMDRSVRRAEISLARRSVKATTASLAAGAIVAALSAAVPAIEVLSSRVLVVAIVAATVIAVAAPVAGAVVLLRQRRGNSLTRQALQIAGRMQSSYLKALNSIDAAGTTRLGRETVIDRR